MQLGYPILSILTLLPVAGMIVTAFVPKTNVKMIRGITVAVTALQVIFAIILWANFNNAMAGINDPKGFQFIEKHEWIRISGLGVFGNVAIDYFMGIDGARFRRPVVPGDQLRFRLTLLSVKRRTMKMRGEAFVDGGLVAEAELLATVVDKRP